MKALVAAVGIFLAATTAHAQDWGNLDGLIFGNLTRSGKAEASFWLPDAPDPSQATRALAVVYEYIEGSAGSVSIAVGHFIRQGAGWGYVGPVEGLFGNDPRDVAFDGQFATLTTTTLGPNEPRCCPTVPVRWQIDLANLVAARLP